MGMLRYRVAILNIYQLCRCLYLAWSFDHAAAQPLKHCVFWVVRDYPDFLPLVADMTLQGKCYPIIGILGGSGVPESSRNDLSLHTLKHVLTCWISLCPCRLSVKPFGVLQS
jgi:hypothetical protein